MSSIKLRLTILSFLQFGVWGAYLVCLGQYLGPAGLGGDIAWFYSIQGIVSIFMPAVMGILADKYIPAQRLLAISHLLAALFMGCAWYYGHTHPVLEFAPFFPQCGVLHANNRPLQFHRLQGAQVVGTQPCVGFSSHTHIRHYRFHRFNVVCELRVFS